MATCVETRPGRGRCAVACAELPPGTVVKHFSGPPYAVCLLRPQWPQRCLRCFRQAEEAKPLLRCSRCQRARYCGARCQAADWPAHKHECAALPRLDDVDAAAVADLLMASRCLWRRHGEPAGAAATGFDELVPAAAAREGDSALATLAVSLGGLLPPGTTEASVVALLGRFRCNNFGVLDSLLAVVGAACHPAAALLNHSCAPNCVLTWRGATLEIRTMRAVASGEELCHSWHRQAQKPSSQRSSPAALAVLVGGAEAGGDLGESSRRYTELCQPAAVRQRELGETYGFACRCERCGEAEAAGGEPDAEAALAGGAARELARARALLHEARAEEELAREAALVFEALALLRRLRPASSLERYQAEGSALGLALAGGDVRAARECCAAPCANAVAFLEGALRHCPLHPLLALQRFTLADLEDACGARAAAAKTMQACAHALRVTHGTADDLCARAHARLDELRELSGAHLTDE